MKLTQTQLDELSKQIFKKVEDDLRDRRGIRHEWDQVDQDIQEEIRSTNEEKIKSVLEEFLKTD